MKKIIQAFLAAGLMSLAGCGVSTDQAAGGKLLAITAPGRLKLLGQVYPVPLPEGAPAELIKGAWTRDGIVRATAPAGLREAGNPGRWMPTEPTRIYLYPYTDPGPGQTWFTPLAENSQELVSIPTSDPVPGQGSVQRHGQVYWQLLSDLRVTSDWVVYQVARQGAPTWDCGTCCSKNRSVIRKRNCENSA